MNPTQKFCWKTCTVCFKCKDKGRYSMCASCSGRNDPQGRYTADPDVYCDCKNGILRHMTQSGRFVAYRFPSNPYQNTVVQERETQDERDWSYYLAEMRNALDDPYWDPIRIEGTDESASDWTDRYRGGV